MTGRPGGDVHGTRAATARQLRDQARSCDAMGSPLYAHLLRAAAHDCAAGGPTWTVLRHHAAPGRGDALALRLMAAVHRVVLERQAPCLARHYASVGGTGAIAGAWEAFRATLEDRADEITMLVALPCQTNEVGRSAGLAIGFVEVMRRTGLPMRLLEVGASAGLNLRCDRFLIGGGGKMLGDRDSPVDLSAHWRTPPPWCPDRLHVVDRRGCDRAPVDPTTPEGRLALTAAVWADQTDRHARLRGALRIAAQVPVAVDRMPLDEWTHERLAARTPGVATVVYHSVVEEYLGDAARTRFVAALEAAGARATREAPLAWVRVEPVSRLRHHGVRLTLWPGGVSRTLARCGAHGTGVEWLGDDNAAVRR